MTSAEWRMLSEAMTEESNRLFEKHDPVSPMWYQALMMQSLAIIAGRMGIKMKEVEDARSS